MKRHQLDISDHYSYDSSSRYNDDIELDHRFPSNDNKFLRLNSVQDDILVMSTNATENEGLSSNESMSDLDADIDYPYNLGSSTDFNDFIETDKCQNRDRQQSIRNYFPTVSIQKSIVHRDSSEHQKIYSPRLQQLVIDPQTFGLQPKSASDSNTDMEVIDIAVTCNICLKISSFYYEEQPSIDSNNEMNKCGVCSNVFCIVTCGGVCCECCQVMCRYCLTNSYDCCHDSWLCLDCRISRK